MEEIIPTPAVFAGSLARTFEYHTRGVHDVPRVRWTVTAPGTISCPVLSDQGVVYIADDQGHVCAIEASSGDLLWSFQSEQVEDDVASDVTATCLAGTLGYVADSEGMLYELDLKTGQTVRSWNLVNLADERDPDGSEILSDELEQIEAILLLADQALLVSSHQILRFDLSTEQLSFESGIGPGRREWLPSIYPNPEEPGNIIYNFVFMGHTSETVFVAGILPEKAPADPLPMIYDWDELWYIDELGGTTSPDAEGVGRLCYCMMPIMDGVLYAFSSNPSFDDPRKGECMALLALDCCTGAVQWGYKYFYPARVQVSQLAAASGLVFLRFGGRIEALDVQTHQHRWTWLTAATSHHFFVADGLIYVFDRNGQITALDTHTGEQRWSWQMEGDRLKHWWANTSQAVFSTIADGTLYVVAGNALYALS